jgi:hypothetical protein
VLYCISIRCMGIDQGSFFGIKVPFLASESGSLYKYTYQS